ncbi:hypothetical protein [Actinokineospora diospyrosa]|uniref:WD40 repeat domain-containing protein n=1 Tax=Actinokineospora diospyrosa TaxID=103728 RepID=A0ABT1I5F7_9PSEU|nr:hypothetical protein [Actinokineospora diospyrosa]MCP2267864.1 hypothetical protein [Actinokineospora diospyrosa]
MDHPGLFDHGGPRPTGAPAKSDHYPDSQRCAAPTAITTFGDTVLTIERPGVVRRDGATLLDSTCAFLCSTGPTVVAGGTCGGLFDAITGSAVYRHPSALTSAAAFADNVVLGTSTGEAVLLSADFLPITTLRLHDAAVVDVAVAGDVLFALSADGAATWWDLATHERLGQVRHAGAIACIALPDNRFATVGADLRLWSESEVVTIRAPHPLAAVAVTDDGMLIAAGSPTGPLAAYDLPTRRWRSAPITGITALHYAADRFLACTTDGTIREIPADDLLN